jgi:hypothetical protein
VIENKNAPTVKSNKGVRFYNPGDRFSEPLSYSIEGIGDIHAIARWNIDAPAESFFQVPTELRMLMDNQRVTVDFPTTVLQKFKDRGVVMVDEEWQPGDDEEEADKQPFARTEKEAEAKGKRLWVRYLQKIVRTHIESCQRARSMGGFPVEASGFTRRAFKLLNMHDPATAELRRCRRSPTRKRRVRRRRVRPGNSAEVEDLKRSPR